MVFEAFSEPLFVAAIIISFLQKAAGFSLAAIYRMEAVCVLGSVLLQVPTGALADLVGRRVTLVIGALFIAADRILFAAASAPAMAWAANLCWIVGFSMISGADSSLLYDSLKFLGREHEFKKISGCAAAWRLFLIAVTSPFAGYLAEQSIRLPMILGAVPAAVFVATSWFFTEPPFAGGKKFSLGGQWQLMKTGTLFVRNHREIKWTIAFVVLLGVVSKIWFFTYNPYFEAVHFPTRYWGWLFLAMNLIAAAASYGADFAAKKVGDFASVILMLFLVVVPMFLIGIFVTEAAVLLVLPQNLVRGYKDPFFSHFLHTRLDSENRATVSSVASAIDSLAMFLSLGAFGLLLKVIPLPAGLQILGLAALAIGGFLISQYPKIFARK